jgi:hypothetical protein
VAATAVRAAATDFSYADFTDFTDDDALTTAAFATRVVTCVTDRTTLAARALASATFFEAVRTTDFVARTAFAAAARAAARAAEYARAAAARAFAAAAFARAAAARATAAARAAAARAAAAAFAAAARAAAFTWAAFARAAFAAADAAPPTAAAPLLMNFGTPHVPSGSVTVNGFPSA